MIAERRPGRVSPTAATRGSGIRDVSKKDTEAKVAGDGADGRKTPTRRQKATPPKPTAPPPHRTPEPPQPAHRWTGHMRSGVRRLDQLLGGGVDPGAFVLLYGAPFLGKEILARRFAAAAMEDGTPVVVVTTNGTADEMRHRIGRIDPSLHGDVPDDLLHFVDAYSRPVGADNDTRHVEYVDGPMDLNGISVAVNEAQRHILAEHDHHVLVVDSASTIVAYSNAQTTFRFLQVLLGKARRVGATTLVLLDEGMHTQAEVQMFKHLMSGSIDLREQSGKTQLRVLGLGQTEGLGWVDYLFQGDRFDVTGSFAAGRIR